MKTKCLIATGLFAFLSAATVHAQTFGSGSNAFTLPFVPTGTDVPQTIVVPEPTSTVLLLSGGAFLALRRRRST